jgi:hypothetical protein
MNVNKQIKKITLHYGIMASIGFIALFVGYVLNFQPHVMSGIAIGFTPTGLVGMLICILGKNKPSMIKSVKAENEERNIFIRNKTGHRAFWITYWYVFAATMASNFLNISASDLSIVTLIFMPVVYFITMVIYHYKY